MDGWMNEWMDGWMDGWRRGRKESACGKITREKNEGNIS